MKEFFVIPNTEGKYLINRDGQIYSNITKKILKPYNSRGYPVIELFGHAFLVHRIVAQLFILNPDNKEEVNHKNGIKYDNRIENLEWMTPSENVRHSFANEARQKTRIQARENGKIARKLTLAQVESIRRQYIGMSMQKLANRFNVGIATIWRILRGKTYIDMVQV